VQAKTLHRKIIVGGRISPCFFPVLPKSVWDMSASCTTTNLDKKHLKQGRIRLMLVMTMLPLQRLQTGCVSSPPPFPTRRLDSNGQRKQEKSDK